MKTEHKTEDVFVTKINVRAKKNKNRGKIEHFFPRFFEICFFISVDKAGKITQLDNSEPVLISAPSITTQLSSIMYSPNLTFEPITEFPTNLTV